LSTNNGSDLPARVQRLEELLEVLTTRHLDFEDEHKRLLRAQVIMADQLRELGAQQLHTNEKMHALISVVDDLVRRNK
jgi:hypothetical protein